MSELFRPLKASSGSISPGWWVIIWDMTLASELKPTFIIKIYKSCIVTENILKHIFQCTLKMHAEQGGTQNRPAGVSNTGMFLKSAPLEPCEEVPEFTPNIKHM